MIPRRWKRSAEEQDDEQADLAAIGGAKRARHDADDECNPSDGAHYDSAPVIDEQIQQLMAAGAAQYDDDATSVVGGFGIGFEIASVAAGLEHEAHAGAHAQAQIQAEAVHAAHQADWTGAGAAATDADWQPSGSECFSTSNHGPSDQDQDHHHHHHLTGVDHTTAAAETQAGCVDSSMAQADDSSRLKPSYEDMLMFHHFAVNHLLPCPECGSPHNIDHH
ncbi:hypothetical protein CAOG_01931 [Capsaspora owczarzaki ATCC 30864]|uniref:Uncharacterized protein n=1 Tax=Capsaspora owczarzaki (strain ATCC 30864) TaxID=595528 RepID=A0A0D2U697_CAPO3|nr:hypothetical protein CAOG_01931 [Capsaspora owczarzaki ATCC 30864]KJE90656.1 hypothetical protein CAOG_001931 [Capsaspora owczarzaki ATCC 30864]|eukprot:XP_004364799.1 hypothetical protein CAOG_01931 [Capsaspora owczarzaki ATCC 30864]